MTDFLSAAQLAEKFGGRVTEGYVKRKALSRAWPHALISREPYFTAEHIEQIAVIETVAPKVPPTSVPDSHGQRTRGQRAS